MRLTAKNDTAVSGIAGSMLSHMEASHRSGLDGQDIVLGVLSALRLFTIQNVYEGAFEQTPETLEWLKAHVQRGYNGMPLSWDNLPAQLTGLNDGKWLTFPQIPDFCATNPPGLWREGTY